MTGYYVSESATAPSASAAGWQLATSQTSYSASISFTLSTGDGTKTVYVFFKDGAGNVSAAASDSITLSTGPSASLIGTWGVGLLHHSNDGTWISMIVKVTFNNDSTGSRAIQENNNETIQSKSDTFTYTSSSNSDGSLTVTMNFADGSTGTSKRVISDDGKVMIWDGTDQSDNTRLLVAVKLDTTKTYTSSDLKGDYYALGYRYKSSDGTYRSQSGVSNFDGSGNRSASGTRNENGTLSTFSDTKTYSVNSDGKYSIDGDPNGYLLGNGVMGISSHVNTSDVWSIGGLLKKQDKTYSTSDLAGTWAIAGFGDDQGTSFHAEFGSVTCDNIGNCTSNTKLRSSDGSVRYLTDTSSESVASDGSFVGSLDEPAPSYAGAIGNNGNTLIINDSFEQADLNGRFIGVAVRCSSCSNLVPVSQSYNAWDPAWSPDGTQIVFTSDKSGNADIWIMNADGTNPKQITTDLNTDWDPAWSPDVSKIVFGHDRDGDENIFNIWVINIDGTNLTQLTFGDTGWETEAIWSPDGSKIAYGGIWIMNADGTNLTKIIDGVNPSWSPDGSQIAFSNNDIWIANADGSNPIQITTNPARDWHPSISPDGTKIAFTSNRSGTDAIWVINIDGTNPTEIAESSFAGEPQWSPDGTKIAYEGTDGNIWIINADGSNPVNITGSFTAN